MYLPMSDEELLMKFKAWKNKVGRAKAMSYLTAREIGPSTADQLARDEYNKHPRKKLRMVLLGLFETP